jgi:hypothetical protein
LFYRGTPPLLLALAIACATLNGCGSDAEKFYPVTGK